jgi:2,4-dienoyl-CoA reductase (NADPH2)
VDAIREVIHEGMPLFVRISATDWVAGGWDVEQSVALGRELLRRGG